MSAFEHWATRLKAELAEEEEFYRTMRAETERNLFALALGADWHGVLLVLSADALLLSVSCLMYARSI